MFVFCFYFLNLIFNFLIFFFQIVLFQTFDTNNTGLLNRTSVQQLIKIVYAFHYDPQDQPSSEQIEHFVGILFDNLDNSNSGSLSLKDIHAALLMEPKLARCFVGAPNEKKQDSDDANMFGLIPLLASGKYDENFGKKPADDNIIIDVPPEEKKNLTTEEKTAVRSKFGSRNELLDNIKDTPDSRTVKGGGPGQDADGSCCSIS